MTNSPEQITVDRDNLIPLTSLSLAHHAKRFVMDIKENL